MLWLVAAAAVSSQPPVEPARPAPVVAQATATVRIISGVRLDLQSGTSDGAPVAHDSTVAADGQRQPARLIEFE
jgi:alkanesulfonate monooxygenase SsuD/methylene tetrahydromethanopterin reductase-like flavin-dependent oxidoreductase (luciferase family)